MARRSFALSFYFHSEEVGNFVKDNTPVKPDKVLNTYEFEQPSIYPAAIEFDKDALPLAFRQKPDTLLNLAIKIVEKFPLPKVYKWTIEHICDWLRKLGYPQYQNTFRENLINGRTLLLLDASALSAMNIKDFADIRRITYEIRRLFYFEMTAFARSISLAPEYHRELYKLLRVKNGTKYDNTRPSDLWRRMQLIRRNTGYKDHWEILERWLKFEHDDKEIIGRIHRYNLYHRCESAEEQKEISKAHQERPPCYCLPPCECQWTERNTKKPWRFKFIPEESCEILEKEKNVFSILSRTYPERYVNRGWRTSRFCKKDD